MLKEPQTLIEYLEYFYQNQRRLTLKKRLSEATMKTYTTRINFLKQFLTLHKLEGCSPKDITIHFIREYEMYLLTEKDLCINYTMKCIHILDRVLKLAQENKAIELNPCTFFDYHYEKPKPITYLELADVEVIKNLTLTSLTRTSRDLFLFGCYTGLSFIDIQNFTKKNIIQGPDGKEWIYIERQKSKSETFIPLLPEAKAILEYYYYKLPKKSNQKVNTGLKTIAKRAGLKQVITSHVARKTFGNILHNEKNVPLETVSKMLGHSSLHTTQNWYVKTNLKKIASDMKGISFSAVA